MDDKLFDVFSEETEVPECVRRRVDETLEMIENSAESDIKWNPGTGLFYNLHYIIDQTLKNVKLSCDTDIVHTLWLIKTKTGTLTSCKQNGSNLALADCL